MIESFGQILSTSNAAVSRGSLLCSQTDQSLKSGHGVVTPIVAKNKLIEVNLELPAADTVEVRMRADFRTADNLNPSGQWQIARYS